MEPVKGIGASFKLADGPGSPVNLVDISDYCNSLEGSSSNSEYDATTFQPGVAVPLKRSVPGFADKGFSLAGQWCQDVEDLFSGPAGSPDSGIEGKQGIAYEYGPEGTDTGKVKITGLCNVMSYSGPKAPVDGTVTWDAQLKVTSRVVGVF